jgi:hypothetical protein
MKIPRWIILVAPLLVTLLGGCNIVKIKVPEGATVNPNGIVVYTSAWKSANATGNAGVEATTSPTTETTLNPDQE